MIYLSESMVMQFSLGEVTGIIALVVSGFAIYISHFYTSRREQIKTSRYMWERINVRLDKIHEIANTKNNNYAELFEMLLTLYFNQKFVHNYIYIDIT